MTVTVVSAVASKVLFVVAGVTLACVQLVTADLSPLFAVAVAVGVLPGLHRFGLVVPTVLLVVGVVAGFPAGAMLVVAAVTVAVVSHRKLWWVLAVGVAATGVCGVLLTVAVGSSVTADTVTGMLVPFVGSALVAGVASVLVSSDPTGVLVPAMVPAPAGRVSLVFVADDADVVTRVVRALVGFGGSSPESVEALVVCAGAGAAPAVAAVGDRFSAALVRSVSTVPVFVPVRLGGLTVGRVGLVRFRRDMGLNDLVASVAGHLRGDTVLVVTGSADVGDLLRAYRATTDGQMVRTKQVTVTSAARVAEVFPFTPALPVGSGRPVAVTAAS